MKKRIWIACGLLLAAVSLSSVSGAGREAAASEKWVARYNGPGNGDDAAAAVALDVSGNIIIVGTSAGTATGTDIATVKLDADGNLVWARLYDGPAHGDDTAKDIAVDAAGNIFVLGSTKSATGTDITAVKYSPAGKQLWVRKYDGTGHGDDEARGIAVDSQGAAIVCGLGRDGHANPYAVVIKYGTKGARLWIKRGIPVPLNVSMATDVVVDPSDNIYVCGGLFDANWDLLTAKYDRNGVLAWAKSLNGASDQTDVAAAVSVTASGAVTIIGSVQRAVYNNDYETVRYDKDGGLMWAKTYNGPANRDESPAGLAVDTLGNAHVTGWSGVADRDYDFATVKYSPTGKVRWTRTYDGPNSNGSFDYGRAVALDPSGNVYVAGESRNDRANHDIITIKYDRAGGQVWLATYDGPAQLEDSAQAVVVDATGNIFVAGTSAGIGTGSDIIVIKYE